MTLTLTPALRFCPLDLLRTERSVHDDQREKGM